MMIDGRVIDGNFIPGSNANLRHGTHVAGIIGAIMDNDKGISGVSQASIALLERGNLEASLEWADNNNIKIVNASYGSVYAISGKPFPPKPEDAAAIANYKGLFIAGAGNYGLDADGNADSTPLYPAGYADARLYPGISNVISVGGIDEDGDRHGSSSFGQNSVSIYAPGGFILSTFPQNLCTGDIVTASSGRNYLYCETELIDGERKYSSSHHADGYHVMSGTSMAAPHVAGVAALLLSANPNLSNIELRDALINSADDITIHISNPAGTPNLETQDVRLLNAFKALKSVTLPYTTSINGNTIEITGHVYDQTGVVTVPSEINGLPVTRIGDSAFLNQKDITEITLPSTITSIGDSAFKNCAKLKRINISVNLRDIGNSAFYECRLLENIILPNSLTTIGQSAFAYCNSLINLTIPQSVTSVGVSAFASNTNLTWNYNPLMTANNFCSNLTAVNFPQGTTTITERAFYACSKLTNVTLPSTLITIGNSAFDNCRKLEKIIIPNNVSTIGEYAFSSCTLMTEIKIPKSVTSIGKYAFSSCSELTTVTVQRPSSLGITTLGTGAFNACPKLAKIYLPDSISLNVYKVNNYWSAYQSLLDTKITLNNDGVSKEVELGSGYDYRKAYISLNGRVLDTNGNLLSEETIVFTTTPSRDSSVSFSYANGTGVITARYISPTLISLSIPQQQDYIFAIDDITFNNVSKYIYTNPDPIKARTVLITDCEVLANARVIISAQIIDSTHGISTTITFQPIELKTQGSYVSFTLPYDGEQRVTFVYVSGSEIILGANPNFQHVDFVIRYIEFVNYNI